MSFRGGRGGARRPLHVSGANAQTLGQQDWTAGSDWRALLGGRRGRGGGRGAQNGGPGRPIPVHINGPQQQQQQQQNSAPSVSGKRPRSTPEAQLSATPSKRRGVGTGDDDGGVTDATGAHGPGAGAAFQPRQQQPGGPNPVGGGPSGGRTESERDRNKKRRKRRQSGKASMAVAKALGASERTIEGTMTDRQREAQKERNEALNPRLVEKTEKEIKQAAAKGDFGAMGLLLLEGVKQTNLNVGKMGGLLSREQELFQHEMRDMLNDIGRQSRKTILEFVSPKLVPKGEYWDDLRLIREVSGLTNAKHGVSIPYEDVGAVHFKGGIHSGCVVVKFLCTTPSSAFGRLMDPRGQPGGWKGQKVDFELLIRQQLTKQDRNVFDLMKWCKSHGQYMRDVAQERGLNPIEVVPWDKLIMYVRSSPQSGAVVVVRSGYRDLTLAKLSDVRGVTRPEWVDAFASDISPHTWLLPAAKESAAAGGAANEAGGPS